MSDESIIVRNQGTIFLGGPPLVKAATGEVVTAEELGGADVHSRQSGVTDHYAQNDAHAIGIARRIVGTLKPSVRPNLNMHPPRDPLFAAEEIYGVVPVDGRKPFDVRDIIARVVDGSEFDEFKKLYGTTLVCGFAHIWGFPVGIIANNGILFSESSLKGRISSSCAASAAFRWCSCRTSPASWSARNTKPAALRVTAPSW